MKPETYIANVIDCPNSISFVSFQNALKFFPTPSYETSGLHHVFRSGGYAPVVLENIYLHKDSLR